MVRLRLDAEDLAHVKVRPGGGPFTEAVFSLRLLRARRPSPLGSGWLDRVRPRIDSTTLPLALLSLVEAVVDLHGMAAQAPPLPDALRRLAGATEALRSATDALDRRADDGSARSLRPWLRALREGDQRAVGELVGSFCDYYRRAVDPYWRSIRSVVEAERSRCGRLMADGGVARLLATLHPKVRWRAPFLEIRGHVGAAPPWRSEPPPEGAEESHHAHPLEGRSLVLVPSTFCLDAPNLLWSPDDPSQPPVLVYPALRHVDQAAAAWTPTRAPAPAALARLLGRTQAAALAAIADTCTTTELAHRVGVSPPTASHHAGILRAAGLVTSSRTGNTVLHRLSPLGADLLGRRPT